jgi:hypothetical protein
VTATDVMEFGKYKGCPLRELPQSYLEWLITTYERHLKEWSAEIDRRASDRATDREGNERRSMVKPAVKHLDTDDLPPWEGPDEFATVRVHRQVRRAGRVKTRRQRGLGQRHRRQVWRQVQGGIR